MRVTKNSDSRLNAILGWWSSINLRSVVPDLTEPTKKTGVEFEFIETLW